MSNAIYTVPEEWRLALYLNPPHALKSFSHDELWQIVFHELMVYTPPSNADDSSIRMTEYWDKWRESNPGYKSKWKVYNYVKKGVSDKSREMYRKSAKERNYIKYKCSHCETETNIGNLNRWHNNNCKVYRERQIDYQEKE